MGQEESKTVTFTHHVQSHAPEQYKCSSSHIRPWGPVK